jgi:catalase
MSNEAHSNKATGSSEADIIALIDSMMQKKLQDDNPPGSHMPRDAHPKSHGLVKAEFIIEPNLPAAFRFGVFAQAKTYPTWIRYSNGAPKAAADSKNDVRGMAMKLMGVPGDKVMEDEKDAGTQDFLVCNHDVFFIRNVPDYAAFLAAVNGGNPLPFFIGFRPFHLRLHEAVVLFRALFQKVSSPLAIRYWSQTPYSLGPRAVKYSVKPSAGYIAPQGKIPVADADYMRHVMAVQLADSDVCLDFMVQLQGAPEAMPVEDPTILWNEKESPFVKVATIRIPKQVFDTAERNQLAEDLSFTPWHTLPEHAPLGGINRVRRVVYEAISRLRHTVNGVLRQEPISYLDVK